MYIQNSTELPFPLYTGLPLLSLYRVITFRNTKLVIEHRASPPREHSAYLHHTQYTGLMLSSGMLPPTKPHTPSKALCFCKKSPAAQSLHLFQCTELRLLHEQYKDICPIIYKTQQNTKLIIIHRASPPREHSAYLHHTQYTELLLPGTQSYRTPHTELHRPSPAAIPQLPRQSSVLFHPPFTELSPYRNITFRNTKLIIIHRASPPREHSA